MDLAHNVPVLMYHHLSDRPGSLSVTARQFESQIRGLAARGYRSLKSEEFAAFMAGTALLPKKTVLITFDDGYLDNWVYGHPVLERYGFSAILFAITGLIGHGAPRPHAGESAPLPPCLPHRQAKEAMFGEGRDAVMLRWSEIQHMVRAGTFEIHSHTHTHTRWDLQCRVPGEKNERIAEDLESSREVLAAQVGTASSHLCWPQGYFDEEYVRIAQRLGFRHLYTTDARGQNVPAGDVDHIYRFAVRNRSYAWLGQRIWLATHPTWGPLYNAWKKRNSR